MSTMPTQKEKKTFLNEHFLYEIQMMKNVVYYFHDLKKQDQLTHFHMNLIIDDFMLHARNLYEFFFHDKDQEDHARAQHFMKEGIQWKDIKPEKTSWIKKLEVRANLEVSHLTYRRISGTPPEKAWDFMTMYIEFHDITHKFLLNVSEEYLGQEIIEFRDNP